MQRYNAVITYSKCFASHWYNKTTCLACSHDFLRFLTQQRVASISVTIKTTNIIHMAMDFSSFKSKGDLYPLASLSSFKVDCGRYDCSYCQSQSADRRSWCYTRGRWHCIRCADNWSCTRGGFTYSWFIPWCSHCRVIYLCANDYIAFFRLCWRFIRFFISCGIFAGMSPTQRPVYFKLCVCWRSLLNIASQIFILEAVKSWTLWLQHGTTDQWQSLSVPCPSCIFILGYGAKFCTICLFHKNLCIDVSFSCVDRALPSFT